MNNGDKNRLKKTHVKLMDNVRPIDVLPLLHQEGIFKPDDEERVLAEKTRRDQLRTLLMLLPLRGPRAYGVFRQALAADYEWIVEALDSVPVGTSGVDGIDGAAGRAARAGAAPPQPIKVEPRKAVDTQAEGDAHPIVPILRPHQPLPNDTAMEVEIFQHGATAARLPPLFRKWIKDRGYVPNMIMKEDLQHMVGELKKATNVPKVLVAVLDTGIWAEHPRLKKFMVRPSKNFVTDKDADMDKDETNHGTIMAGILVEFAGICVEFVNFKVGDAVSWQKFQEAGMMAIKSWEKETDKKVHIILTSINANETEYTVRDEFDKTLTQLAEERIIICAAANKTDESDAVVRYPATHPLVLGIGSRDIKGNRSTFSTKGHALDFLFPGEQFVSTSRPPQPTEKDIKLFNPPLSADDWMTETTRGTSFASPHCAAAVAIILSYTELTLGEEYRKGLTRTQTMRELLIEVCEQDFKVETGYGYPQLREINSTMIKKKVDKMCRDMKVPITLPL